MHNLTAQQARDILSAFKDINLWLTHGIRIDLKFKDFKIYTPFNAATRHYPVKIENNEDIALLHARLQRLSGAVDEMRARQVTGQDRRNHDVLSPDRFTARIAEVSALLPTVSDEMLLQATNKISDAHKEDMVCINSLLEIDDIIKRLQLPKGQPYNPRLHTPQTLTEEERLYVKIMIHKADDTFPLDALWDKLDAEHMHVRVHYASQLITLLESDQEYALSGSGKDNQRLTVTKAYLESLASNITSRLPPITEEALRAADTHLGPVIN